jgi:hypothetical protein
VAFAVPERLLHGEHEWLDYRWISRLRGRVPVHGDGNMQEPRPQQIFCNCARLNWVELIMFRHSAGTQLSESKSALGVERHTSEWRFIPRLNRISVVSKEALGSCSL